MRIVKVYSHLNGLEYIQVHLPHIWTEIQAIITAVDATLCRTKVSREKTKYGKMLISPVDLNQSFKTELESLDWKESRASYFVTANPKLARDTFSLEPHEQKKIIEDAGEEAMKSYNQTDFVKDRVAIEVQFGKYSFVAYDLFVKHMAFYVADKIDVGIEILPMKELQQEMSSGVPYYEGELYNVIRQGRGVPAVPLVIIGIAP